MDSFGSRARLRVLVYIFGLLTLRVLSMKSILFLLVLGLRGAVLNELKDVA
jgi:hypothetical protein